MRRGTRVGQAYVNVTADGSGINEEIVDSIDEAGPGVEKAGREHGDRYGENFGDSLDVQFSHAAENLGTEFNRRMAEKGDDGGEQYGKRFEKSMKKMAKRIGQNVGSSIGKGIETELFAGLKRIELLIESQLGEVTRKVSGNMGSGGGGGGGKKPPTAGGNEFPLPEFDDRRWAEAARMDRQFNEKMTASRVAFVKKFLAARERMTAQSNKVILQSETQLVKDQQKLYDSLQKDALKRDADLWKVRNATAKAHYKYLSDLEKGRIDEQGNSIKRLSATAGRFDLGKMLGAGSRNDFFNLFGRSIGGIVNLLGGMARTGKKVTDGFVKGFGEVEEGASLAQKALGGFSGAGAAAAESAAALAASAPVIVAGILTVIGVASALVSVISALTALVVGLSATIVSALTGAVLVLGGAFAAAAAAAGLLVAAFASMNDEQKKLLADAFHPLKDELLGIGQLMITQMVPYFETWSANLQQALLLVAPVAQAVGDAFGQAGARLTASLSGPGFKLFAEQLGTYLPSIVKRLTGALGGFMNGMAGIFGALLPYVKEFAGYLNRAAAAFSEWANSAQGQSAIQDFVERALDSLESLWDFIKQFSGFITDVLFNPKSQKAGNSMFESLADSFEGFRKAFKKAADDGSLEDWFNRAIKFGGDLKDLIIALKDAFKTLDNSGVLDAVGKIIGFVADQIERVNTLMKPLIRWYGFALPKAVEAATTAFDAIETAVGFVSDALASAVGWVQSLIDKIEAIPSLPDIGGGLKEAGGGLLDMLDPRGKVIAGDQEETITQRVNVVLTGKMSGAAVPGGDTSDPLSLANLIAAGHAVHSGGPSAPTGVSGNSGGKGGDGKGGDKKKWHNPYVEFANRLIKDGPSIQQTLAQTLKRMNKETAQTFAQAAKALDLDSARSILRDQMENLRDTGRDNASAAQDALNSAAETLKSASGPKEAARALKAVKRAQKDLADALKQQKQLNALAGVLDKQRIVNPENVERLLSGLKAQNATLADFAQARALLAEKIEAANQQLEDAISTRDNFAAQIANSVKAFGALTTAQGQVIDGVEQALTAGDIVSNLEDRLKQIQKFQSNLRVLLAQGLSDDAYKQILEAGVDQGGTFAQALIDGGIGAITNTNSLVEKINGVADELGLETSTRLYQAGVDAAQGLVDGLESLSDDLDAAAVKLGNSIALAVARALGIKGKRLRDMMEALGTSTAQGLDAQSGKVTTAARRFSSNIEVSPAAAAASGGTTTTVSGNGEPKFLWTGDIVTPTKDPHAVAQETLNELTGRLP